METPISLTHNTKKACLGAVYAPEHAWVLGSVVRGAAVFWLE